MLDARPRPPTIIRFSRCGKDDIAGRHRRYRNLPKVERDATAVSRGRPTVYVGCNRAGQQQRLDKSVIANSTVQDVLLYRLEGYRPHVFPLLERANGIRP